MEFSFIYRQGNKSAHLLAKHAVCIDFSVLVEENSYFLRQVLFHDISVAFQPQIKNSVFPL